MRENEKGIRLQLLQIIMLGIAVLLAAVLILTAVRVQRSFVQTQEATDRYAQSLRDAGDLEDASDYLTLQVRAFAITADPQYMENYFEETKVTKRRDLALQNVEEIVGDSQAYRYMQEALRLSEELEQIEYYAMRLVLEASDRTQSEWPQEVQAVELTPQDAAISADAKKARASEILYDEEYMGYKERIYRSIAACTGELVETTKAQQLESADRLSGLLHQQFALIAVMLAIVFLNVLLTYLLIIRPMERSVARIRNQEKLPESGAYEMRFLAKTYNKMYEENEKHSVQLSYEASHDSLTGLYNRGAFDRMREDYSESAICLILADVDDFKKINDTMGHDAGDTALRNVAAVLRDAFRSEDKICRIGGDEFAVIMVNAGSALKGLVERKMKAAAAKLQTPPPGVPPVTISVGVAFGDRPSQTGDLYKDADTALYRVKDAGRNGIAFYGEV